MIGLDPLRPVDQNRVITIHHHVVFGEVSMDYTEAVCRFNRCNDRVQYPPGIVQQAPVHIHAFDPFHRNHIPVPCNGKRHPDRRVEDLERCILPLCREPGGEDPGAMPFFSEVLP